MTTGGPGGPGQSSKNNTGDNPGGMDASPLDDFESLEPVAVSTDGGSSSGVLVDMPAIEQVSEDDFGNLEALSREAVLSEPEPADMGAQLAEPIGTGDQLAEPIGTGDQLAAESSYEPAYESAAPTMPNESEFSPAVSSNFALEGMDDQVAAPTNMGAHSVAAPTEMGAQSIAALTDADVQTDVETTVAPPPRANQSVHIKPQAGSSSDSLEELKNFGDKIAIANPRIDASPPFSMLAEINATEATISRIKDVLTAEDYGVQFSEIEVQLKSGKLFIPKISEFAAIQLAQQIREVTSDIQIGLSIEIFKAKNLEITDTDFDNVMFNSESLHSHKEDVRDMGSEPKSEKDLFSTHMDRMEGYRVTRILSALNVSKVVGLDLVEDKSGRRLEDETQELLNMLLHRAFKLGAHGIIGMNFTLKSLDVHTTVGKKRGFRLWGTATAVRAKAISN